MLSAHQEIEDRVAHKVEVEYLHSQLDLHAKDRELKRLSLDFSSLKSFCHHELATALHRVTEDFRLSQENTNKPTLQQIMKEIHEDLKSDQRLLFDSHT
jgi:hypothetical protein